MKNTKPQAGGSAKKAQRVTTGTKVSIGASLTAAAVAAAGAYFLYGSKNASKNRKKVASWVEDAKAEVMKGLKKAKSMSEAEYHELVEKVAKAHSEIAKLSKSDISQFKKDMAAGWKVIAQNASGLVTSKAVKTKSSDVSKSSPARATKKVTGVKAAATPAASKAVKVVKKR
jgi:hypothetical protein